MNNKIREFAKQAEEYAYPYAYVHSSEWFQLYNEKLVELVILECCKITNEVELADVPVFASKFLKVHFGVEK